MVDALSKLFPGAEVVLTRSARPAQHEFRFFPSARWPNLVVPVQPARAAAHTAWRFSTADGPVECVKRAGAAALLRAGVGRLAKDRIVVSGSTDSVLTHLSSVFERPVTASVAIGTARVNRKPVLQVFDHAGQTLGFAKVGIDSTSYLHVTGEATNLAELGGRVPEGMVVPELLDVSTWRGNVVLVMSALGTRPQRPGVRTKVPVDLMSRFSRMFDHTHQPLTCSPFWQFHYTLCRGLEPHDMAQRLESGMQQMSERWGHHSLETGAWHGDWTPWNMAWRGTALQVWDFERFDKAGLVGLDVVHFVVNERMQRCGASSDTVLAACGEAQMLTGLPAGRAEALAASYLLSVALRYLASAGDDPDSVARGRAALMTRSLELLINSTRKGYGRDA